MNRSKIDSALIYLLVVCTILLALLIAPVAFGAEPTATLTTKARTILHSQLNTAGVDKQDQSAVLCVAENIYFEARAESYSGKAAVANVTRNRVLDKRWPDTYCAVVQQGPKRESWKTKQDPKLADSDRVYYPRKHRCQFSWYCDGKKDVIWANYEKTGQLISANARAWTESVQLAIMVAGDVGLEISDNTGGAVFYYNHNLVYPNWADAMQTIGILGNHTFLK